MMYGIRLSIQHQNVSRSDPRLQKKIKSLKKIKKKRIDKATEDFLEIPGVEEASEFRFDSTIHVHRHKKNSRAIIRNT